MAKQTALQKLIEESQSFLGAYKKRADAGLALPKKEQLAYFKKLKADWDVAKQKSKEILKKAKSPENPTLKPTISPKEPVLEKPPQKTKKPKAQAKPAEIVPQAEVSKSPIKPASTLESKAISKSVEDPSKLKQIISDEVGFKPEGKAPLRGAAKEFSEELIEETPKLLTSLKPNKIAESVAKAGLGKTVGVLGGKILPAAGFAYDAYDVGKSIDEGDYSSAARKGLGGVGSFLGGLGGGIVGSAAGPVGTVGGAVGGSMIGQAAGEGLYDVAKNVYDKSDLDLSPIKTRPSPRPGGMDYYDEAPSSYPKYNPSTVSSSSLKLPASSPDLNVSESSKFIPYQESDRPKSLTQPPLNKNYDKNLEDFIGAVESNNDYTALNPSSGARGKYQFTKKDHEEEIKKRYGMSFEEAMDKPEIQDRYFREAWLPQNKKLASELAQTPEAKSKMLDEFTLTALLQLGQGNVKQYLAGTLPEDKKANIENQINYFRSKADQYKRNMSQEELDETALEEQTKEMQKSGNYLPFKSAQAKMDTLREGSGGFVKSSDETPISSFASKKPPAIEEDEQAEEVKPTPMSRLEQALLLQQQYEKMAQFSRGAERLSRGLIGAFSKTTPGKMSEAGFEEGLSRMGKQGVEGAKLLEEAEIKKEELDPTSATSKKAREQANAMFKSLNMDISIPETTAAKDLKQFTDLAKYSTKAQTASEKNTVDRLEKAGAKLRPYYDDYESVAASVRNVRNALAKPNAQNEVAALYGFIKALDQNSAVREGELKLAQSTISDLDRLVLRVEGFFKERKPLDDAALKNIADIMNKIHDEKLLNYTAKKQSVFAPLGVAGIPESTYQKLDPLFLRQELEKQELEKQKSSSNSTLYKDTNIRVHD